MTTFKTKYNRRSFLKVSAAASGGMVIGFSWLASCSPTADQIKNPPKEWFDINAYLKIGDNGLVTIMSPNPEIGQNVKTSMPMLVAEELEVDWKDVIVEQAPLNTEWYTRQVAGGSQSIRQGWESLRMAGATAREMLVAAAAAQWQVEPKECKVEKGIITNAKGEKLGFGDVASAASKLEVPEEVTLKEPKDFKIIGQSKKNVDINDIITGKPLFGLDYKKEGMVIATVMRPPAFGQELVSFDDSQTRQVKGVLDVFKFKVTTKEGGELEKIAIVANSTWAAIKGKRALKAEWKQASAAENTVLHDEQMMGLMNKSVEKSRRQDGEITKAFAEADEVLEKVYEAPFLPHNCMEPMNFFAHVVDGKANLAGPIQTPQWTRSRVADLLGYTNEKMEREEREAIEKEKVLIDMTRMGGGFGRRLYGDFALEAAKISQKTNKPVKVVFTREDDMTAGTYRPASKYKIRAAIKDGNITGYHLIETCMNANMYGVIPNNFPAAAIDNYQVDNHQVKSNITIGAWRAPYTNFLGSAEQSFFDELAEKMKIDAVQLRLDLLEKAKQTYAKADSDFKADLAAAEAALENAGNDEAKAAAQKSLDEVNAKIESKKGSYDPERMIATIKLAAEKAKWGIKEDGIFKGFSAYYSHNTHVAQVAHVQMKNGKPVVTKVTCAVDCGIVVNPDAATNLVQGGVVDGIGHALYGDFGFEDGKASAQNFDKFRLIRMGEAPEVDVHFVKNTKSPTGLGEPTFPPAGAALANAIYKATGERLYKQPYIKATKVLG